MRCRSTIVFCGVLVSCAGPPPQETAPHDWLIIPGTRIGPVGAATSEQDLIELIGSESVVRHDISIGEGMCAPGTVLYSGTSDAVAVMWLDTTFTSPAAVEVASRDARWRTPAGLHAGITLTELESLAAGVVEFTGFGWDYGGTGSWSERTAEGTGQVIIGLAPDDASLAFARQDPRYREIVGEHTVRSDHPLVRQMTVIVERVAIRWREPAITRPCPEL